MRFHNGGHRVVKKRFRCFIDLNWEATKNENIRVSKFLEAVSCSRDIFTTGSGRISQDW